MILSEAVKLLRRTEDVVLARGPFTPLTRGAFQRHVFHPFRLLMLGSREGMFRGLAKWAFGSQALLVLLAFVVRIGPKLFGEAPPEIAPLVPTLLLALNYVAFIAPALIAMFPVPSVAGFSGIHEVHVGAVAEWLLAQGYEPGSRAEIKMAIDAVEKRSEQQLVPLKWAVGIAWAVTTYQFTKFVEAGGGVFSPGVPDFAGALRVSLWILGTFAWFLVVDSYDRGIRIVLRTALLALGEVTSRQAQLPAQARRIPPGAA